jgi:hypothetical protein
VAEPLPAGERERICWLQHTRERTRVKLTEPTAVDFSNLKSGYVVRSPFQVDFSIRGMGVIPAGKPHPKAGHHHVLVDFALPTNLEAKIPFNDFHRHFGKGQTGTSIALPQGKHTLRLLFADHDHRPYFVFSPEIAVTVAGPRDATQPRIDPNNFDATCAAWYQDELTRPRPDGKRVLITNLRNEEPVVSPINVRLAADGFGVAPRGHGGPELGHFQLEVQPLGSAAQAQGGRAPQVVDLGNGATQANLVLAVGTYRLRVRFFDDARNELLPASDTVIVVTAQERL